jgi:hypothetical protein
MEQNPLFSDPGPEVWKEIRDFPNYEVSSWGNVRGKRSNRLIAVTKNSRGVPIVGLMGENKKQQKRSLPLLVAEAHVSRPDRPAFNTPIHLDGNRLNNTRTNLIWRPLWFARKYLQQFEQPIRYPKPIEDVETRIQYEDSRHAATIHGLLELDIRLSMLNNTYVFPTGQIFRDVVN